MNNKEKTGELIKLVEGINDPFPYDTIDLVRKVKEIMGEEDLNLFNIRADIKSGIDELVIGYVPIEKVSLEIIPNEIKIKVKFNEVFKINKLALLDEFRSDLYQFLILKYPEIRIDQISMILDGIKPIEHHWCNCNRNKKKE